MPKREVITDDEGYRTRDSIEVYELCWCTRTQLNATSPLKLLRYGEQDAGTQRQI